MREIIVRSGERLIGHGNCPEHINEGRGVPITKELEIVIDGKLVTKVPIPPKAVLSEPVEIGSQVLGTSYSNSGQRIYTKIRSDTWVYEYNGQTHAVRWSDIAVCKVINPKPEVEILPEPQGWAAIVETDCWDGCHYDTQFVRLPTHGESEGEATWVCRSCHADYRWVDLIKDHVEVNVIFEGVQ